MIRLFKNKLISKSFIELQIRKMSNSKKVLVFLATGAEEMEVCITVDVLRRVGFDVKLAGVNGEFFESFFKSSFEINLLE